MGKFILKIITRFYGLSSPWIFDENKKLFKINNSIKNLQDFLYDGLSLKTPKGKMKLLCGKLKIEVFCEKWEITWLKLLKP